MVVGPPKGGPIPSESARGQNGAEPRRARAVGPLPQSCDRGAPVSERDTVTIPGDVLEELMARAQKLEEQVGAQETPGKR